MTSTLLSPSAATVRRTGAAGLAAALAAAAPRWLHLVEYRPDSRWTHLLPADEAADVLDPALHADLADAQVWLLSWLPEQGTPLHDHGTSAGAFSRRAGHAHRAGRRRRAHRRARDRPPTSPPAGCGTSARTTCTR